MDGLIVYNKHYVILDDRKRIIDGWSDGPHPEKDTAGAVCISERGGYQFRLFPEGEENPALVDPVCFVPLYQYLDGTVQNRAEEEVQKDQEAVEKARAEEQAKMDAERAKEEALTEAQAALVMAQINTISVDDATALRWRVLYPEWSPDGVEYSVDDKVQRGDKLYKCQQANTSQPNWAPELAPALWTEICETHAGTEDDPIPYDNNMALEAGKYYSQAGVTYRCTRGTGIPVYNPLSELVGLYVERI